MFRLSNCLRCPPSPPARSDLAINSSPMITDSFLRPSFRPSKPHQRTFRKIYLVTRDSGMQRAQPGRNKGDRKSTGLLVYQLAAWGWSSREPGGGSPRTWNTDSWVAIRQWALNKPPLAELWETNYSWRRRWRGRLFKIYTSFFFRHSLTLLVCQWYLYPLLRRYLCQVWCMRATLIRCSVKIGLKPWQACTCIICTIYMLIGVVLHNGCCLRITHHAVKARCVFSFSFF